ncbi:MAG TPA: Rid family hydrolase [Terriglobales bacterium]
MHEHINLPGARQNLPFSDAVVVGNTVYLSGRLGLLPGTTTVPDDPREEARLMLDGFKEVLTAQRLSMSDLVYVQIFTPDVSLFGTFNDIYLTYFDGKLPARAFLGSGSLLFGARFEMIGIAAKP